MRTKPLASIAALLLLASTTALHADDLPLTALDLKGMEQDWGDPQINKSVGGHGLSIAGVKYESGIGTHAVSSLIIDLGGNATRFTAKVGFDDEEKNNPRANGPAILFRVVDGDNKTLFASKPLKLGDPAETVDIDLTGVKLIKILTLPQHDDIGYTHGDWVDAKITYSGAKPRVWTPPAEEKYILTPKAPATPRINGPKVFGVRPGSPILFKIPATGQRPMTFSAGNLPPGVTLDPATGLLGGAVTEKGTYLIQTKASNALGESARELKLVVGDTISLTPPMGWNSWNCFAEDVSAEKIRHAADAFISAGLLEHGWTYINIDDCWQVKCTSPMDQRRDANGKILTNARFPDMKALADYVHSKGLKVGLYSSPGVATCGNYAGSYKFEEMDAKTYAEWGYDYLKYDWCSYGSVADEIRKSPDRPDELRVLKHPYEVMNEALKKQPRDILYSLCQYGMGDVSKWGGEVGGQAWRTTGDITDTWRSLSSIGFDQGRNSDYAKPGNWNDPDMLIVGMVGWGPKLHPTRLTPNEQYTHITLWSMLASPLLIGCDLTQLDEFTLSLLTNDEVLAVNQDSLGKQARRVKHDDATGLEVWLKDLEDGTKALALFNRNEMPQEATINFADLGLTGPQTPRDLWRQKDLPNATSHKTTLPRHGTILLKLTPAK